MAYRAAMKALALSIALAAIAAPAMALDASTIRKAGFPCAEVTETRDAPSDPAKSVDVLAYCDASPVGAWYEVKASVLDFSVTVAPADPPSELQH